MTTINLTLRQLGPDAKGVPLTNVELDQNFVNLKTAILTVDGKVEALTAETVLGIQTELSDLSLDVSQNYFSKTESDAKFSPIIHQHTQYALSSDTYTKQQVDSLIPPSVNLDEFYNKEQVDSRISDSVALSGTQTNTKIVAAKTELTNNIKVSTVSDVVTITGTTQSALKNKHYIITSTSKTTVTLPSSPTVGDIVSVTSANDRADNVVARGGSKIAGYDEDLTIDTANKITIQMRYVNSTLGWVII